MVQLYNLQFGGPEYFQIWTNYIFYIISPQPNTITQKKGYVYTYVLMVSDYNDTIYTTSSTACIVQVKR